jgi:hypothetical protein
MALNEHETLLLEALNAMLSGPELGLAFHTDKNTYGDGSEKRNAQFEHENIDAEFRMKANAENFRCYDGICAAFTKIHSYKYLNDTTFNEAFKKEMTAMAVNRDEMAKALDIVDDIVKDRTDGADDWAEKDYGLNPNLDAIKEVSQPEQNMDFEEIDSDLNKMNIDLEDYGNASPSRMP